MSVSSLEYLLIEKEKVFGDEKNENIDKHHISKIILHFEVDHSIFDTFHRKL